MDQKRKENKRGSLFTFAILKTSDIKFVFAIKIYFYILKKIKFYGDVPLYYLKQFMKLCVIRRQSKRFVIGKKNENVRRNKIYRESFNCM